MQANSGSSRDNIASAETPYRKGMHLMGTAEHREKAGHGPVTIAIVTVSDTRTPDTDQNRQYIEARMRELGHTVAAYRLIKDEPDQVAAALDELAALPGIQIILFNGGT